MEHTAEKDAAPKCDHCGHVRGLHGRNHGCISAFADGEAGKSCGCPGYVTPPDDPPATTGTPYHHEDERECYRRADASGWWPWRFEDGVLNRSAGTICLREHPRVTPPEVG